MADEDVKRHLAEFMQQLQACDEFEQHLQLIQNISSVAKQIGKEETLAQLIPFLEKHLKLIYYGEDMFPHYSEELIKLSPIIFHSENIEALHNLYEVLCDVNDILIRQSVSKSLITLSELLDETSLEVFVQIIFVLLKHVRFPCRCTSLAVVPAIYPKVSNEWKEKLRNVYMQFAHDPDSIVRKEALIHMNKLAVNIEHEFLPEIILFLKQSMADEDNIRMYCIDLAITLANILDDDEEKMKIIPIIEFIAKDPSWKIRSGLASKVVEVQTSFGISLTKEFLVKLVQTLAEDDEEPVRFEISNNIVTFAQFFAGEELDPIIENEILELIKSLHTDSSKNVVATLGQQIMGMREVWGEDGNKKYLLPMILQQIASTDIKKVDDCLISNINQIITMMELDDIAGILEKTMFNLQTTPNTNWRARRNLAITIVKVMQSGVDEYFKNNTFPFFFKLLSDDVFAVRRAVPTILPLIIKHYGMDWSRKHLLNKVFSLLNHPNYHYRLTVLFCIDEMIDPSLQTEHETYFMNFTPTELYEILILISLLRETMNCTLFEELELDYESATQNEKELYFEDMLAQLDSMDYDFLNDVKYLKSLILFTMTVVLKELKNLCSDKIYNVRNRTKRTLHKIYQFHDRMKRELREDWAKSVFEGIENKTDIEMAVVKEISDYIFVAEQGSHQNKNQAFEKPKKAEKSVGKIFDRYVKIDKRHAKSKLKIDKINESTGSEKEVIEIKDEGIKNEESQSGVVKNEDVTNQPDAENANEIRNEEDRAVFDEKWEDTDANVEPEQFLYFGEYESINV